MSFSLIEITKPGTEPRLLVAQHFFPGTRGHRLIAQGSREAMFAALRLMETTTNGTHQGCGR